MATRTTGRDRTDHAELFDPLAAFARMRELNERVLENTRRAGGVSIDLYENTAVRLADSHERIGAAAGNDAVTAATRLQAEVARTAATTYAATARAMLELAK